MLPSKVWQQMEDEMTMKTCLSDFDHLLVQKKAAELTQVRQLKNIFDHYFLKVGDCSNRCQVFFESVV
jgi:catechol-2,3-dioxygenase